MNMVFIISLKKPILWLQVKAVQKPYVKGKHYEKRFTACMIGATLLTAALTGCSGGKTADAPASSADQTTAAEAASTDAASEGKVAIELFYQKPENVELYNTLVNKFMEENPDIQGKPYSG
ncbi:MAG: hypothetical protein ACLSHX_14645 [Suilimivivens sp.]